MSWVLDRFAASVVTSILVAAASASAQEPEAPPEATPPAAEAPAAEAPAATPARLPSIEEITITARKREESLQEVPISVSALTGDELADKSIRYASDLARFVPSLQIAPQNQGTASAVIYSLRGQAQSDITLNFDPAVSVYVDGVNIAKPTGTTATFFDLERVEVLKGPQGTLYGRNTTGGAVNYFTKRPDHDGYHGYASADFGNYDAINFRGAINVPIIDQKVAARFGFQRTERDGYVISDFSGQDLGNKDEWTVRGGLVFDLTESLHIDLSSDWTRQRDNGGTNVPFQWVSSYDPTTFSGASFGTLQAAFEASVLAASPCYPIPGLPIVAGGCGNTAILAAEAAGNAIAARYRGDIFHTDADAGFHDTDVWGVSATVELDLTESIQLKSISAFRNLKNDRINELDGTHFQILMTGTDIPNDLVGASFFNWITPLPKPRDQTLDTYSQEFDLSGQAFDERLDWLGGVYWSKETGRDYVNAPAFPGFLGSAATFAPFHLFPINIFDGRFGATSWSVFSQASYALTEKLSITGGARFTEETKSMKSRNRQFDPTDPALLAAAFPEPTFDGGDLIACTTGATPPTGQYADLSGAACETRQSISFDGWSYLVSLDYQATDFLLLYVKTARGFRGGGWQLRAAEAPAFEPETATDYEVGLKGDFFDERVRTNFAFYHTQYDNKQESIIVTLNNTPATIVQNAADATIDGVEVEAIAAPVEGLRLALTYAWLDGTYDDFDDALSITGAPWPHPDCAAGPPAPPSGVECGAAGEHFTNPKHTYTVSARYQLPIQIWEGTLGAQLDWQWRSKPRISDRLTDPALITEYYDRTAKDIGLLNMTADYTIPGWGATLQFFATNLLDKGYQLPGIPVSNLGGSQNALTMEPRMWGFRLQYAFGGE